jgi:uncharacterized membrane protein
MSQTTSREAFEEFSLWGVGLMVLMVQVFPLAIPLLVLILAAAVLLLLPVLVIGLLVAVAVRWAARRRGVTRRERPASLLTEQTESR